MPIPKKYLDFIESEPKMKPRRYGDGEREYISITCPQCNCVFVDIPKENLWSSKASKCKAHLAVCPKHETTEVAKKRKKDESEEGDDEGGMAYQLQKMREELHEEKVKREQERIEAEWRHQELMAQFQQKKLCLTDVRAWGALEEPDDTLVPQLEFRDKRRALDKDADWRDVLRAKDEANASLATQLATTRAQLEARLEVATKDNAQLRKGKEEDSAQLRKLSVTYERDRLALQSKPVPAKLKEENARLVAENARLVAENARTHTRLVREREQTARLVREREFMQARFLQPFGRLVRQSEWFGKKWKEATHPDKFHEPRLAADAKALHDALLESTKHGGGA